MIQEWCWSEAVDGCGNVRLLGRVRVLCVKMGIEWYRVCMLGFGYEVADVSVCFVGG